jgi:hypothetical protein
MLIFLFVLHVLLNYKKQTLSKICDHGTLHNRISMYMDDVFVDLNVTNLQQHCGPIFLYFIYLLMLF